MKKKQQQQQQQGRTSESDAVDGVSEGGAPPLPARAGAQDKSMSNGTKSTRSLSFSSKDGVGPPPPIPSRPSTTTSSRSNSVSSVVGGGSGAGVLGGSNSNLVDASFATQPQPQLPASSSSSTSSSSYVSSLLTRNAQTLNSCSDSPTRINPFDKNTASVVGGSSIGGLGGGVSSSDTSTTTRVEIRDPPGTTLDDLIKNRFAKQQGVQDEATGRYKPKLADAKAEPSFEDMKNELFRKEEKRVTPQPPPPQPLVATDRKWSETDSVFSPKPQITPDPVKSATTAASSASSPFSKFSRTNSTDAEIIFGSTGSGGSPLPSARPKYDYSIDSQSSFSSDADNIFGRKDEGRSFLKSLSVSSSADDRDFSADPRVKSYEGVQNVGFTDTDSGIGAGGSSYRSATVSTSSMGSSTTTTSYKWAGSGLAEEDYDDLK